MKHFSPSTSWALALAMSSVCLAQDFSNGQAARLVVGQSTFTEADVGAQAALIGAAAGIATNGNLLFVADANRFTADPSNNRVLIFPMNQTSYHPSIFPQPTDNVSQPPFSPSPNGYNCFVCVGWASLVLGQPDFNNNAVNLNQSGFRSPIGVATDGVHLIVADSNNNRVMIWNSIPTQINQPADVVVGQADFLHNTTANPPTATSMRGPQGVWISGGKLIVADTEDNRVLIYNSIPTKNGAAADIVVGQPNMTTAVPVAQILVTATQSNLTSPVSATTDGARLIVTDLGANRVMIWNKVPTANGTPADVVVGQPDFVSFLENNVTVLCTSTGVDSNNNPTYPNLCEKTLSFPRYAISDGTRLFIADGGNDRVLVYSTVPTTNGPPADRVLGEPDFVTDNPADGAAQMYTPTSLAWDGTNLYVADAFNRRILAYSPAPTQLGFESIRNAASLETFALGTVTIGGTITAKDTVAITIALNDVNGNAVNKATYTYTVQTNDTLDDIVNGLVALINKSPGDPNVTALADTSTEQVILVAKTPGSAGTMIAYSTTLSANATETATTAGANLAINLQDATQIAPGTLMTIFGSNLADSSAEATPSGGYYPFSLNGVEVYVDGIRAALVSVSPTQVNAQMPFPVFDRTSSSVYVRTTHSNGTVTVTTPVGASIPLANPGIFAVAGSDPRQGYVYHAYTNATSAVSVDGTITAGDVGSIKVGSETYTYKVQGSDTLVSVQQAFVNLINSDPNSQVTATASNVYQRILLVANQSGPSGEGIAVSATVTTGTSLILTALTPQTCCSNATGGLVTDDNPAQPGEVVYVLATGLGITTNQSALNSGQVPEDPFGPGPPVTPVDSILAGGSTANILFTNYYPGALGTFQVTFQLSSSLANDALTQLTIAQQSFVSNVVTFNVTAGSASSSASLSARRTSAPPPVAAANPNVNPAVKPKKHKRIDKSLQKKV